PDGRLTTLVVALVTAKLLIHVVAAAITPYEFHRDEFLYFAMGTHLDLFRMDFPPMIALLSEALRHTVGVSVFTYRLLPGLAGTLLLMVALQAVRALGGGRLALLLTGAGMIASGLFLRSASLFQPVVFDQVCWTAALYALLRLEQTGDRRWWLGLGLAGGLGLLTKFSIGFIGLGVLVALLLSHRRRDALTRWPWTALAIVAVLGSPSVIGQVALGFPVIDQMSGLAEGQLARIGWGEYLSNQPLMMGPAILLAFAGMSAPFLHAHLRPARTVAVACGFTFLLLGVLHGKPYYIGPIYPMLYAIGAVAIEQTGRAWVRRGLGWAVGAGALVYSAGLFPFGLPVIPPEPMARYSARVGLTAATQTNWGTQLPLPQDYADMLGWREKADAVALVVASLTPDERARAVLYGRNYGQAGALDLYGRQLGLPPVVSLAGSFYTFGPGDRPGEVVVLLGVEPDEI
ncbi:MAG: glycosyltransferase family 39 protein, partial [Synechococcaceae cyanobacterium]|nr:glycosyltransferase family 39 protein [Synechococcaceae cyanobacterium]